MKIQGETKQQMQQIPFVLVDEVEKDMFLVHLYTTTVPSNDPPFVTIRCSGLDTGKLPDEGGAALLKLWDSTGELIAVLQPHRSARKLLPERRYIPDPYFDWSEQRKPETA